MNYSGCGYWLAKSFMYNWPTVNNQMWVYIMKNLLTLALAVVLAPVFAFASAEVKKDAPATDAPATEEVKKEEEAKK